MEGLGSNPTILGLTMTLYQLHALYASLSGPHTRLRQDL